MRSIRPHIGIFGKTNSGKSSFLNKLTAQQVSIVSEVKGTTTDPVIKSMEMGDLGPVVFIDTAGIDDESGGGGGIGHKRVQASKEVLGRVDLAIILLCANTISSEEESLIKELNILETPFLFIHHKSDLQKISENFSQKLTESYHVPVYDFSSLTSSEAEIKNLISIMKSKIPEQALNNPSILSDLISYGESVLLVTPIDAEAPRGRIILPQVQTIRDILDNEGIIYMMKERELDNFWKRLSYDLRPKIVITDSQVFLKVASVIPPEISLTSFSILFARLKGDFERYIQGTKSIKQLKEHDNVLILESCSHHISGDDIGRVKIPRWLSNFTGKRLQFDVVSGLDTLTRPIHEYALVIQCGGCMLTRRQILNRLSLAIAANIPITNYGMAIAYAQGIFERAIHPFEKLLRPGIDLSEDYL
ncbi:MAG: [FeFe] hydrogenase H-cluster maturation GTPase HydF [Oligoflexia bacterium]|nr:[FeFe] hydrogenase H-cluster maturation GTPase HydF [Oligoflexia bacterium]